MSASPSGQIDIHDWRRIAELFAQAFVTFLVTWVLQVLPLLAVPAKFAPFVAVVTLLLTEIVKRRAQGPTP